MTDRTASTRSVGVAAGEASAPRLDEQTRADVFRRIFATELDYVMHSLRRLGIPERDLPDLTHDSFVIVHRKLDRYDPSRPIRPWLFGIAFRVASDHRSLHRNRREHLGVEAVAVSDEPAPDEVLEGRQERRLLYDALATLPIERRAVLVMHEIDSVPIPEIAAALEIPLNTAYSRLRLARHDLEIAVKRLWLQRGRP